MKTLITTTLLLTALLTANAQAIIITGQNGVTATAYGNPFTGSTNTDGPIGAGTAALAGGYSLANVVSQKDGTQPNTSAAARITGSATSGFMQFVATTPFTAGTVISSQFVGSTLFNSPMSYNLLLNGNMVQSGAGIPGSAPILVTTLASKQTVQTLRLNMAMSTFNGVAGTTYADMDEVLILPDRLGVVPSTATATSTISGLATQLDDLKGGNNYWIGSTGSSVTLTFSGTQTISALVLSNVENTPNSSAPLTFNILNSSNIIVANGSMSENGAVGEFVGIDFNTPVTTSSLKFTFTNAGNDGMIEIIPLETIPEPASMSLVAVGGLMLLKRRRR